MAELEGRTALVTGASRGIGRQIARRLAAAGSWVAVHYGSDEVAAEQTLADIEREGGHGSLVRSKLGIEGDVDLLLEQLRDGLRGRQLDVLVNNAGILPTGPFEEVTREEFDRSVAVNTRAPFFLIQRLLPHLADGARIINLSSAVTRIASPFLPYAMTKGAIEAMTRTLANTLGPRGITVNAVAPGVVDTDMGAWVHASPEIEASVTATIPLGRLARPDDIADIVAFLASPGGRWITGATIDATGGQWLGPLAANRDA